MAGSIGYRRIAAALMIAAAVLLPSGAAHAAPSATRTGVETSPVATGWGEPAFIPGSFISISGVIDSRDHVHIVVEGQGAIWYVTDRSGTLRKKRILIDPPDQTWADPSIALDVDDRVHVAALLSGPEAGDDGIWWTTDRGRTRGSFGAPVQIAPSGTGSPSLKVVDGKALALAAVRGYCCVGDGTVVFRTNVTGRWTSTDLGRGSEPSLRLDDAGRPRVAWTNGEDAPGVWYAAGAARRGAFGAPVRVRQGFSQEAQLALDDAGRPHIAWVRDSSGVEYTRRTASGWQTPSLVRSGWANIGLTLDLAGRPQIAVSDNWVAVYARGSGGWSPTWVKGTGDGRVVIRAGAAGGRSMLAWLGYESVEGIWVSRRPS